MILIVLIILWFTFGTATLIFFSRKERLASVRRDELLKEINKHKRRK